MSVLVREVHGDAHKIFQAELAAARHSVC